MVPPMVLELLLLSSLAATPPPADAAGSLDLEQALALARAHSRKLADRKTEVEISAHRRGEAFGRFLPRLGFTARYSRLSYVPPGEISLPFSLPGQGALEPIRLGDPIEDQVSFRLALEQPLFTGLALLSAHTATRHTEAAAQARLALEEQDLEVKVEEAYLGLLKARQLGTVAELSVRALEAHLVDAERLLRSGALTVSDLARVKARVAAARLQQIQTQGAAELAQLALATLLGLDSDAALSLAEPPPPLELPADPAAARARAQAQRPELKVAREVAAAREAQARAAHAPLWPQLGLRATLAYEQPNARYFPPKNQFDWSWDVSVVGTWTLWDWGTTWHSARAAAGEAELARRQVEELSELVQLDVERRRRDAVVARSRIDAAQASADAAQAALERATALCSSGQSSCTQVLESERELTQARSELVNARADVRLTSVQLRRATGGTP